MKKIYPALLAHTKSELEEQLSKLKWAKAVQLDIIDGKFVAGKTYSLPQTAPYLRGKYVQAHLMVNKPAAYLRTLGFADEIIYHVESGYDIIDKIKQYNKKAGISFNPSTDIRKYKELIKKADISQIMTVHPGKMGAKFLGTELKKIAQIKRINPKIIVGVDGGVQGYNIQEVFKAGADYVIVGSGIQKAENPEEEYKFLEKLSRKTNPNT